MDLCEFEARLVYRASSRTARATQGNHIMKGKKKPQNKSSKSKRKDVFRSLGMGRTDPHLPAFLDNAVSSVWSFYLVITPEEKWSLLADDIDH